MTNDNHRDTTAANRVERPDRLAYSVTEAAALTGLGKTTLYALMGTGALPSCKIGKRRLIASIDLQGLIGGTRAAAA